MTEVVKVEPGRYETKDGRYQILREPDAASWFVWDEQEKRYVDGAHYFEVLKDAKKWVARNL